MNKEIPALTVVINKNVMPTMSLLIEFTMINVVKIKTENPKKTEYIDSNELLYCSKF